VDIPYMDNTSIIPEFRASN